MQRLIAETPPFVRQADELFCEGEKRELIDMLADDPSAGEEVPGTNGIRKLCFAAVGRGRRDGGRTIYILSGRRDVDLRAARLCAVCKHRDDTAGEPRDCRSRGRTRGHRTGTDMSAFGEQLIRSLGEALVHSRGEGPAIVHPCVVPRQVREKADITQAQMAPLMGMSLSGYREWEQARRRVSGPVAALLHIMEREPVAVRRALLLS